jgi:hypothetical protein
MLEVLDKASVAEMAAEAAAPVAQLSTGISTPA